MNKLIAAILAAACANAPAFELAVTRTEKATCDDQGGCIVVTRQAVVDMVREAHRAGLMRCGQEL